VNQLGRVWGRQGGVRRGKIEREKLSWERGSGCCQTQQKKGHRRPGFETQRHKRWTWGKEKVRKRPGKERSPGWRNDGGFERLVEKIIVTWGVRKRVVKNFRKSKNKVGGGEILPKNCFVVSHEKRKKEKKGGKEEKEAIVWLKIRRKGSKDA